MTDNASHSDPSSQWPEDIKKAYEHLKIPSLHDALLTNEKLSLEVRRQNRELKSMTETLQSFSAQLNALLEVMAEEWEEYEGEEGSLLFGESRDFLEDVPEDVSDLEAEVLGEDERTGLEKHAQDVLMDTHDALLDLSRMAKQLMHQLLTLLPKTEGIIPHEPVWHSVSENMIQNFVEATDRTRYQLLAKLEDMQIEVVDPKLGEAPHAVFHRVLDQVKGGKAGTIAHVIRIGYRQNNRLLRPAEVTIYI